MKITEYVAGIEASVGSIKNHIIFTSIEPDPTELIRISFVQWQELKTKIDKMIKIAEENDLT